MDIDRSPEGHSLLAEITLKTEFGIAEIMAFTNAIFALLLAVISLVDYLRCRKNHFGWSWIKIAMALLGFYWCGIYIFAALADSANYNSVNFGQTFIRPAFTLTFALMLSAAIIGIRRKCPKSDSEEENPMDPIQ